MVQKKPKDSSAVMNSDSEGFAVPLSMNLARPGAAAPLTEASINLDLTNAPAPQRKFVADGFAVQRRDEFGSLRLFLGQSDVRGGLRALLDVHLPTDAIRQWTTDHAASIPPAPPLEQLSLESEPAQTVAVAANFFRFFINPLGACLDCYYASANSVRLAFEDRHLRLDPVVRVQLSTVLFIAIFQALKVAAAATDGSR